MYVSGRATTEGSRGYATLAQATDSCPDEQPPPRARWWKRHAGTASLVAGLVAASAAVGLVAGRGRRQLRKPLAETSLQLSSLEPGQTSFCGKIEVDVEYSGDLADSWGTNMDHIPTPEMCCAMCHGIPKCQAFIWVKDAGLDGCPSQCWMKGAVPPNKVNKKGIVSGVPPPRPPLPAGNLATAEPSADGKATFFCFSLAMPFGYEPGLLRFQRRRNTSIFGCDATAVYSNRTIKGIETTIVEKDLTVHPGGDSYTLLNSWVFIAIFKKVIDDGWHTKYDWVVKIDPDAVFFPDRLRDVVREHASAGYIQNCKFGLHGPIEVISKAAMTALAADYDASDDKMAPKKCVEGLHFGQWGEDFFLSQCFHKILGVTRELDETLMCEAHCECPDWFWCQNGTKRVTFHPFKQVDLYKQCLANALGGTPLPATAQ